MKIIAAIALLLGSYSAQAGCNINLQVKNNSYGDTVMVRASSATDSWKSKVRTSGGTWRALTNGGWIGRNLLLEYGEQGGGTYRADFSCSKKRRYRIAYNCNGGNVRYAYYPSSTTWTKNTNIRVNLGCP